MRERGIEREEERDRERERPDTLISIVFEQEI